MQQLESQSPERMRTQPIKTAIMVIGGAEDKVHGREILHTFFARAGSTNARLAIIPAASREPAAIGERYRKIFAEMGAKQIELLDVRERQHCESPMMREYLENCTGVFLTGGDQLRLCSILADTPLMETIHRRVKSGQVTLAGTSAGAAVMGHHMIAGGGSGESPNRSLVDIAIGLGFLPDLIVDQHFHNRNRMARLISAIATHPTKLGMGIDEDTCALFERDGVFQVMGKGTVTFVDPREVTYSNQARAGMTDPLSIHNLRVHVLSHGDRYDLNQRSTVSSSNEIR